MPVKSWKRFDGLSDGAKGDSGFWLGNILLGHRGMDTARREPRSLTVPSPTEIKKRRQFRKFSYRGIDLDQYVRPPTFFVQRLQPTPRAL